MLESGIFIIVLSLSHTAELLLMEVIGPIEPTDNATAKTTATLCELNARFLRLHCNVPAAVDLAMIK